MGQYLAEGEPRFVYVMSTGRCGTHWLARAFDHLYGDCAVVEHEPLGPKYRPKETLRCYSHLAQLAAQPPIANHLARIDRILERKTYIECGWPAFAAVPLFIQRYGSRLRLIHLVRHPVTTSASYLSLGHYNRESKDNVWQRLCQLTPFDPGIKHRSYEDYWGQLQPYEKCLFHWLEIHDYAEEIKRTYPSIACHTVRMEDLFSEQAGAEVLAAMLNFIGLSRRPAIDVAQNKRISTGYRTDQKFNYQIIHQHPEVMTLAKGYGYGLDDLSGKELHKRYQASFSERLRKRYLRPIKRLYGWFLNFR